MKSTLLLLTALWMSLLSPATGAQAQIDPDAVEVIKDMIATYQRLDSYSAKSVVSVTTWKAGATSSVSATNRIEIAWQKGKGLRIEGTHSDHDYFVALSDGEQVHTHWIPHNYTDTDKSLNENEYFFGDPMPGLPYAIPDVGFVTGLVTVEKLRQLTISRLSLLRNTQLVPEKGKFIDCNLIKMDYITPSQRSVQCVMMIGVDDNVIYQIGQIVTSGGSKSNVMVTNSDVSDRESFPAEYWTLDAPLMGAAANVTAPEPPSSRPARSLPTFTVSDVYGKPFTVSPANQKTVFFYFFSPGDNSDIDHYQQLAREGELRGLQVVGVVRNIGIPASRTISALRTYLTKHKVTFPVYTDEGEPGSLNSLQTQLGAGMGPATLTTTLIYGTDGQLKSEGYAPHPREVRAILNSIAPIPLQ